MDMTGEYRLPAPRDAVWNALNDPEILKRCIPGCEEIEKISETELAAKVSTKIGPMKARFAGKVFLEDLDPPNSYSIRGEGQGGAAGFAKGGAKVALEADGAESTILRYEAHGNVGGKLAQLGSRLIDATARKMADEFFGRFAAIMSGAEPTAAPEEKTIAESPAAMIADTPDTIDHEAVIAGRKAAAPAGGGLNPWLWGVGLIIVVAALLALFAR